MVLASIESFYVDRIIQRLSFARRLNEDLRDDFGARCALFASKNLTNSRKTARQDRTANRQSTPAIAIVEIIGHAPVVHASLRISGIHKAVMLIIFAIKGMQPMTPKYEIRIAKSRQKWIKALYNHSFKNKLTKNRLSPNG